MTEYQKRILLAQSDFLKKESDRYLKQWDRLFHYSWLRKLILGKVYDDMVKDCEESHEFIQNSITEIARILMEKTLNKR